MKSQNIKMKEKYSIMDENTINQDRVDAQKSEKIYKQFQAIK